MNRIGILSFFKLYKLLWLLALPFLKKNARLKEDFDKRISSSHLEPADIWLQAASAGEAYLTVAILRQLRPESKIRILITSTTAQGRDILLSGLTSDQISSDIDLKIQWFHFDMPDVMHKVVATVQPKLMILLETEIWPSLLYYLKANKTKIMVANARMSKKSFIFYKLSRFLWKNLAPDLVLAILEQDGERFHKVFESRNIRANIKPYIRPGIKSYIRPNIRPAISIMPNIKFESPDTKASLPHPCRDHISSFLPEDLPLTLLASINKQEEKEVLLLLKEIIRQFPAQVVGICPRHMNRINTWEKQLSTHKLKYHLRSDFDSKPPSLLKGPAIILWDIFGELKTIYEFASVVFVGGSLKPLGGQNMLEPLALGTPTIIGPYYEDFAWAAEDMIQKGLLIRQNSWENAAQNIVKHLKSPVNKAELMHKVQQHIGDRQGGAQMVCREITKFLGVRSYVS